MILTKKNIAEIMPGKWYIEPSDDWCAKSISEYKSNCKKNETLFIAMDKETWLKGTGNSGVYAEWNDTHDLLTTFDDYVGVVVQRPIKELPSHIPQYVVEDSYQFINHCAKYVKEKIKSKTIAITGTVGKTSTKNYLNSLLKNYGSTYATLGNHNSRTGVKLTLSNAMFDPDYLIVETAMAALWMKNGGISQLSRPDIAIITEIGVGQRGCDEDQTADYKSRIANGLKADGLVILNRDIKNYDQLLSYVNRYSHNVLNYGKHANADVRYERTDKGFVITVKKNSYHIPLDHYVDDGTLSNMVASFATLYALNLDISKVLHLFKSLNNKESTLELLSIPDKKAYIIDDTYNAEYLSMVNAFKYCHEKFKKNRKILVVGDIINLEKKSREVHESLLEPILANDFELIATFGKDTHFLNQLLPNARNLGHYTDANECAKKIQSILKENDVVLVKGSRRNSTIAKIPNLIIKPESNQIDHLQRGSNLGKYVTATLSHSNFSEKIWQTKTEFGIGSLILIYLALKKYSLDEIQLNSIYKVTANVDREAKRANSLGLLLGESYYFCQILQYTILTQKPDCILALAEQLYQTTSNAVKEIKQEAEVLGINPDAILNVTGRNLRDVSQEKTFLDVFKVAKKIFELPDYFRKPFFIDLTYFKEKIIRPISIVASYTNLNGFLFIGGSHKKIYIGFSQQPNKMISIHYSDSEQAKIEHTLPYHQSFAELPSSKKVQAKSPYINILGDTYFGESYTKIRKRRKIEDALQKHGYNYSFEKIAPFFGQDDINIANFEAVFTVSENQQSPLDKIKPFILGADAEKTLNEFKNRNINHVVLANNHLKDYGSESLKYTLDQFEEKSIAYIGAGRNQQQANEFFEIEYKDKKLAIFNGYWHRDTAYNKFDFYALGERDGVACTSGILVEQIKDYRTRYPSNKIMVICHWGIDFKPIHDEQTRIAKLLISCGVDIIIGHGPHTIQPIDYINNKPVIYSIGNGVFNSNGEYDKHQAMPYGCIVRLDLDKEVLKLYPIFTNNLKTFWCPYFVNPIDFDIAQKYLLDTAEENLTKNIDKYGHYLEVKY
ncbi:CapA family protein [Acinetobacter sp. MD2(2019)]|uniref:CapA family protein n=1 Tax=Acinetobacter sp. MD2(2019) TaxID=2605273 RepID=UPI002D1F9625|nr:CapA family protein [Acinetobacter sp. MD2(2019)]MEB3754568.1 CapA family protein [Acinetobacter sp. MD2(2019)]